MEKLVQCSGCECSRTMTLRCLPKWIVFPDLRGKKQKEKRGDTHDRGERGKAWGWHFVFMLLCTVWKLMSAAP